MYDNEIDLSLYYSKTEVCKLMGKTQQQLWRLENFKGFPKSIIVTFRHRHAYIRPSRAMFLKKEVHEWIDRNGGENKASV